MNINSTEVTPVDVAIVIQDASDIAKHYGLREPIHNSQLEQQLTLLMRGRQYMLTNAPHRNVINRALLYSYISRSMEYAAIGTHSNSDAYSVARRIAIAVPIPELQADIYSALHNYSYGAIVDKYPPAAIAAIYEYLSSYDRQNGHTRDYSRHRDIIATIAKYPQVFKLTSFYNNLN